jgi:hypothetical protein
MVRRLSAELAARLTAEQGVSGASGSGGGGVGGAAAAAAGGRAPPLLQQLGLADADVPLPPWMTDSRCVRAGVLTRVCVVHAVNLHLLAARCQQ